MNHPKLIQAGQIDVNDNDCEGITRHQFAALIVFESADQVRQAMHERRVEFELANPEPEL